MNANQVVSSKSEYREAFRETFDVFGVNIDAVQIGTAVARIERWIREARDSHIRKEVASRLVTFTNVHAVMEARRDRVFQQLLNDADMVCPDGMPLVWGAQRFGLDLRQRVCGPDLMLEFCKRTHEKGYSHYFFGGANGIAERLAEKLTKQFPGLRIAGIYSPPFRKLTAEEDRDVVERINSSHADVLWVGLGCPKQELWMQKHRNSINVPVMLGVGQAFDVHAGTLKRAPQWMCDRGLEWAFRLWTEPHRLWMRYLKTNMRFLTLVARHELHRKRLRPN
jgi:N-acetylglucosaminyldiphosphoundecaprenol N-acetyl-beta-D-mannosaminyltransferase